MKNLILITLVFYFCSNQAKAQEQYWSYSQRLNIPMGDFTNFVNEVSYRGGSIEYRNIRDNISIGGSVGWTGFYENTPRETFQYEGGAITAEQWNFLYATDFNVTGHYYLSTPFGLKPYIGAKVGTTRLEEIKIAGIYETNSVNWGFNYRVGLGLLFQIPDMPIGLKLNGSWNQTIYESTYFKNVNYIGVDLGIYYSFQFTD